MRVQQGRGDWRPRSRIATVRRYAFIGDSTMYGAGVRPDQTLPVNAENQFNEQMPGWPVEAVNFGVSGYNLINSWLAFKQEPHVYDGVILALCNNDADLFCRTYKPTYDEQIHERWESSHPFGQAVIRCFDDIAEFSRASAIPVAVCFFNAFGSRQQLRIGEIVGALCAARNIAYIDSYAHYRERNFTLEEVLVSAADGHPSALAHEAIGRRLGSVLAQLGWFGEFDARSIEDAAARTLATAQAMVADDGYSVDAALHWALRTLQIKIRVARRVNAAVAGCDARPALNQLADTLSDANRRWHVNHRAKSFAIEVASGKHGVAAALARTADARLRFDELGFAIGTGDWMRLSGVLADSPASAAGVLDPWPAGIWAFFAQCKSELAEFRKLLVRLRDLTLPPEEWPCMSRVSAAASIDWIATVADSIEAECSALAAKLLRLTNAIDDMRPPMPDAAVDKAAALVDVEVKEIRHALSFLSQLTPWTQRMIDADSSTFTSIELTVGTNDYEPARSALMGVRARYEVPNSLAFANAAYMLPGQSSLLLRFYVPVFYVGRLDFSTWSAKEPTRPIEITVLKMEVYNRRDLRQTVLPSAFRKGESGQLISPRICLI